MFFGAEDGEHSHLLLHNGALFLVSLSNFTKVFDAISCPCVGKRRSVILTAISSSSLARSFFLNILPRKTLTKNIKLIPTVDQSLTLNFTPVPIMYKLKSGLINNEVHINGPIPSQR